jgi:hypothetical protein
LALQADFRAWRVFTACRGIAQGLSQKRLDELKPEDVFPSLRALKFAGDGGDDGADEEDIAMQSFRHLQRSLGA